MDNKEREFAQIVLENKRRIYTVCYMFSKDADDPPNYLLSSVIYNYDSKSWYACLDNDYAYHIQRYVHLLFAV